MKKQERLNHQEEMLSLIEQWQESGKNQQVFCQEHDLTYTTFYYWLRRYLRQLEESSFLPIEISSGSHIEIRYPGGVILQLPVATRLAVLRITANKKISTVLLTESPWSPTGVALYGSDLYVLEYLHTTSENRREWLPRVRKVSPDGAVVTIAAIDRR